MFREDQQVDGEVPVDGTPPVISCVLQAQRLVVANQERATFVEDPNSQNYAQNFWDAALAA